MTHDRSGHDPNRSSAGDQDVLAQDRERKGSVRRVAKRIENGSDIAVNTIRVNPDIRHGKRQIFRECARTIDTDAHGIRAEMTAARETISAVAANDMAFAADNLTGKKVLH